MLWRFSVENPAKIPVIQVVKPPIAVKYSRNWEAGRPWFSAMAIRYT